MKKCVLFGLSFLLFISQAGNVYSDKQEGEHPPFTWVYHPPGLTMFCEVPPGIKLREAAQLKPSDFSVAICGFATVRVKHIKKEKIPNQKNATFCPQPNEGFVKKDANAATFDQCLLTTEDFLKGSSVRFAEKVNSGFCSKEIKKHLSRNSIQHLEDCWPMATFGNDVAGLADFSQEKGKPQITRLFYILDFHASTPQNGIKKVIYQDFQEPIDKSGKYWQSYYAFIFSITTKKNRVGLFYSYPVLEGQLEEFVFELKGSGKFESLVHSYRYTVPETNAYGELIKFF